MKPGIRLWLHSLRRKRQKAVRLNERKRRHACPRCDPTGKAMQHVRDQWVVAGIDKGD